MIREGFSDKKSLTWNLNKVKSELDGYLEMKKQAFEEGVARGRPVWLEMEEVNQQVRAEVP